MRRKRRSRVQKLKRGAMDRGPTPMLRGDEAGSAHKTARRKIGARSLKRTRRPTRRQRKSSRNGRRTDTGTLSKGLSSGRPETLSQNKQLPQS
jgi:hypothetical protein